ncbi:MAG: hypothetical protein CMP53_09290 [Flavobacteriales bacterium]|nr:hypothetical protein [Flavobacteriales bacterium]|tara:strand:- start:188 stop:571 length:384 start_codon:yes stop_codon:yes gene_type:complete
MARVDSGPSILRVQKFTYNHAVQGNIDPSSALILGSLPDNAVVIGTHIDTTVVSGTSGGPISITLKIGGTSIVVSSSGSPFHSTGVAFESDLVKLDGIQNVTLNNGSGSNTVNQGIHDIFIQYYQGA